MQVTDLEGLKRLMMLNKFQGDPASRGCPGEAIAARFDLPARQRQVISFSLAEKDSNAHAHAQAKPTAKPNAEHSKHSGASHTDKHQHALIATDAHANTKANTHAAAKAHTEAAAQTHAHSETQAHEDKRQGSGFDAFGMESEAEIECEDIQRANGGIDGKVVSLDLVRALQSEAISGPTHDDQPPFVWCVFLVAALRSNQGVT